MNRYEGEIVHAMSNSLLSAWGDVPDIVNVYDVFPWTNLRVYQSTLLEALRRAALVPALLRTPTIVTPTTHTKEVVVSLLDRDPKSVRVIPCGLDLMYWTPISSLRDKRDRTVLVVGGDHPRKNLLRVVEACALAKARLRLIGLWHYPNVESNVKRLARDLGVEINDLGYVSDERLLFEYRRAGALVSMALDEGFGLTPVEALACGTPVVVSNIPTHIDACGTSALYVDPFDVSALAENIERAFSIERDESLRKGVLKYAWPLVAAEYVKLYQEIEGP